MQRIFFLLSLLAICALPVIFNVITPPEHAVYGLSTKVSFSGDTPIKAQNQAANISCMLVTFETSHSPID